MIKWKLPSKPLITVVTGYIIRIPFISYLPIIRFILQSAGFDTPSKEDMATLLVAAIQVIATLVSSVIVDKAGKYNALY